MGLKMDYSIPAGVNIAPIIDEELEIYVKTTPHILEDAYVRVNSVVGTKLSMEIDIKVYTDQASEECIHYKTYEFTPSIIDNAPNFIKQGYEYLKTLEEFSSAIDC